jgi:3-phosphoinositide dependent protein kinase-1
MVYRRSSLLLPEEKIQFTSRVEARPMRRRASRLIPITVSPLKPKIRQLILTTHRLVCVKMRERGVLSKKCELVFQGAAAASSSVNAGGKDSRAFVMGVETKTDREFMVLTVRPTPYPSPSHPNPLFLPKSLVNLKAT